MIPVSKLTTARPFRIAVAVLFSLLFFHTVYVWKPLVLSDANTEPTRTSGIFTTADADAVPSVPSATTGASELKPHSLNNHTAIPGIPDKVWHSAKNNHVTDTQRTWINSWTDKNPRHREELLTDDSGAAFVKANYQQRPDIVEVYNAIPIPILRADLLRYLIVLAEGGIWSDLDVTCDKPVVDWVPPEYKDHNVDMIVGLEFDFDWRGPGTEVASQFCNWAFAAQPSSRNLQAVVDSVIKTLQDIARTNGVDLSRITLEMLPVDVVNVTGPKIMTFALLESLGQLLGRAVDDRDFAGIKHPKLLGDLLIMPGVSFAAAQNRYPKDQGDALVTHHYEGSWKQADAEAKEKKKEQQQP
ncbi:hypothetical protein POX_a01171 [Penicillium oxalicum]|uniref:hypothetical protein n=1 Tax=Penicillium oxalicum TaxID=69781 RepID=UPI0020B67FD0|nr:hypothetical protein POX_a01171 [Penicillium oxalicum]KAI2794572.1 hypothetical protein POX_a01171 [Penicillium oxalicum]